MKSNRKALKKDRRGGSSDRRLAKDEIPKLLPMLQDQLCIGTTLRFVTTSAFGGAFGVTSQNLLDAWFMAGTATTAYQLFDFVRVKSVTIRAIPSATSGAVTNVGVEFYGISGSSVTGGKQKMNTSLGYDTPSFVTLKPDPMSLAANFQASASTSLFIIRATDVNSNPLVGAIVDVAVVYRNSGDVNPAALGTARAGLTAGNLYYGGLDGAVDASTQCRSAFIPRA